MKILVVGAGLAGASVAWHARLAGHTVTVLERDRPASPLGSSHGSARILRYAYANPAYVRLMAQADAWWDRLERDSGRTLVRRCGALDLGPPAALDALAESMALAGVFPERLSLEDVSLRFPELTPRSPHPEWQALFHARGGVLNPEAAVNAMLGLAGGDVDEKQDPPFRLLTGVEVSRVEAAKSGATVRKTTVHTNRGTLTADHVVVAAGAFLPELELPAPIARRLPRFTVTREQFAHFPLHAPERYAQLPTCIWWKDGKPVYALPGEADAHHGAYKMAIFQDGEVIGSGSVGDRKEKKSKTHAITEHAAAYLPGVQTVPESQGTCLFTSTATEDFALVSAENVTVLSACSGHGAKFAPLMGAWVLDTMNGAANPWE